MLEFSFRSLFGVSPEQATSDHLINTVIQKFDALSYFKEAQVRMNMSRRRRRAVQKELGLTRRSFIHYKQLATELFESTIAAAQPHLEEDLTFLAKIARDPHIYANTQTIVENWVPTETEDALITQGQKDLLKEHLAQKPIQASSIAS